MEKRILITLDGFCHSGKTKAFNFFLNNYNSENTLVISNKQKLDEYVDSEKSITKGLNTLYTLFNNYLNTLSDKYKLVITNGYFMSDYVYSHLYNRKELNTHIDEILEKYIIINFCFIPPSYKYYLKECASNNEEVIYTEAEFTFINQLYKKFNKVNNKCINLYVDVSEYDNPELLFKKMLIIYNDFITKGIKS